MNGQSALQQWRSAVNAYVAAGIPYPKAVARVDKEQPSLRESMLAEVNANRPNSQFGSRR